MTNFLSIDIKEKQYRLNGSHLDVLHDISFEVSKGEFVSIIGPSGCGKTTLLNLILGLDVNYEGSITLDNKEIKSPGLDRGIVFQEHRLIPWLNARANIEFALPEEIRKNGASQRINELITLVGLNGFEKAWIRQLSGGMKQKTAIARALVNLPSLLLLDEPFGSLDAFTRNGLQKELKDIIKKSKVTTIMVTHEIDEAIFLSDKIIVLSNKPTTIKSIISITMKEERKKSSKEFSYIREQLLKELYEDSG